VPSGEVTRSRGRRGADAEIYARHTSTLAASTLLQLGAVALGMSLALDRFLPLKIGPFTPTFIVGLGIGTLGFWTGVTEPIIRRYLRWIIAFDVFAVITVVAANDPASLKNSSGILIWLLFTGGFAALCVERSLFRSMLIGLVIGAVVLLVVVVFRFVTGRSVLDTTALQLLGLNRNAIDISIVWLIAPVMWSKTLGIPRLGRWLFLASSILWLVKSQGRTGLVALVMVPLVYLLLKPATPATRVARVVSVAALSALVWIGLTSVSVPWLPATERISRYQSADRSEADQTRSLLNEKSVALAKKHPVFGVGFDRYNGQYDPVIEKASSPHIYVEALSLPAHNTYYEILATTGFLGLLLYAGALGVPLFAGIRHSYDSDTRALTAGYIIVLFVIAFHTSYGSIPALPVALTMAAAARAGTRPPPVEARAR
jgi:hypothetical protein